MTDTPQSPHEWAISGMDCASCATKVRNAVSRLPGTSNVSVTLMAERLRLTLDETATPPERVEAVVRSLGYGIAPKGVQPPRRGFVLPGADSAPADPEAHDHADHDHAGHDHGDHAGHDLHNHDHHNGADHAHGDHAGHDHAGHDGGASAVRPTGVTPGGHSHSHTDPADTGKRWFQTAKGRLVILTAALLGVAWIIELGTSSDVGLWAFTAACLIGVFPVAQRAVAALRHGQPFTIESLMTIAAIGALFIGAAEEAALVVFLFAVGEVLEGVAANKARDGIRALADLVPRTAVIEIDGTPREVPASSLTIGQTVLVRPGDRIPADGTIADGTGGVDESPVTGESVPRTRGPGDAVFAGSISAESALRIRVTAAPEDNTIARIIRLVEEAEESRAPTERFIDRFSRWYMPAIVTVAALVVIVPPLLMAQPWDTWIYRGLALLLIGCPCALVISVPASIASALSAGARRGLLLKGGAVIEAAATVRSIAFDKTGTLTHGRPEVTDIVTLGPDDADAVIAMAAAVEGGSNHPLAKSVVRRAAGLTIPVATDARAIPGKGVVASVDGRVLTVASPRHAGAEGALDAAGLQRAAALESEGKTVAVLFAPGQALALIALRDEPRADAAAAIGQLQAMGLTTTILTGDNPRTAAAIAATLGTGYRAEMLPADKLAAIRDLGGAGGVMMIGDGINDAPALRQADVGVAMGSGTDVALETADAAILRERVVDIPAIIRLARRTMGNIHQNVAIALGLKAVFLVTSVLGLTGLWIAILADTGATVLVTLNALRLLAYDPGAAPENRG